eukprot:27806_2
MDAEASKSKQEESLPEIVQEKEDVVVEPPPAKRKKMLEHETLYTDALPSASMYERSFMHRDVLTHAVVTRKDFVVTVSTDGQLKFWKKMGEGIEFVKHYKAHLETITGLSVTSDGLWLATCSLDRTVKIFDVINFDMVNIIKLDFIPYLCEFISPPGDINQFVAVTELESGKIHVFNSQGPNESTRTIEIHHSTILLMKYN